MNKIFNLYIPVNGSFKYVTIVSCALLITGFYSCKVTKPYHTPGFPQGQLYRNAGTNDTSSIAKLSWRQIFTDTLLQKLISDGINHNIDLQTAYSKIRQSQANYDQSKLAFYPSLDGDASVSTTGLTKPNNITGTKAGRLYQAELTTSWEADIWGKLKSAKKANLATLLQADANARAVQTSLIASIANDYYNLMALDQQLKFSRESVKSWQATVDVMKKLKMADIVTGAAVVQSEASKYVVAATIPDLEQSIWQTENEINFLVGNPPGPVKRDSIAAQQPITTIGTGVPAELLANRPDVQVAEQGFRNSFELVNVARTYFYPSVTLSGYGGYTSLTSFFGVGSLIGNLTAGLTQPIFNKGANKTRLKVAQEQQLQSALNFQNTLLNAGQEVSNALYSYRTSGQKIEIRKSQLVNLEKSVNYTQQLVRYGSANYTEVLTAQQSLLAAQLNQVQDRLQQLQSIVFLYSSLGGGWK